MAKSEKGTSSVAPKEKSYFLDDDIGKDFGSSWKSMSGTNDDAMDFGFDTVNSGKKNKFDFDKLDMDFNLDGDFGKLPSFKMGMADLDFDTLPKKSMKPNERSETESSEKNRGASAKKDPFSFSFDFNEIDSFNFDSSPLKAEKSSQKNLDNRGSVSDIGDGQGSKTQQVEDNATVKVTATAKHRSSENKDTSNPVSGLEGCNSIDDTFLSDSTISGNLTVPTRGKTSKEEKVANTEEETSQYRPLPENEISANLSKQAMQNIHVQSVGNESTKDTDSNPQADVCPPNQNLNSTSGNKESKVDNTVGPISDVENSGWKDSSSLRVTKSESNKCERKQLDNKAPVKNVDETEPSKNDVEAPSTSRLPKNTSHNTTSNKGLLSSTMKLPFPSASSESLTDRLMLMKEKEDDHIRSDIFQQTEETGHQLSQPSSAGAEDSPYGKKRFACLNSFPANDERNKLIGKNDIEAPSTSRLPNNTLHNTTSNKGVLSSTTKLPFPSASEPLADRLTLMKEKEDDRICSDIFQQTEETGHQLFQPSSAGAEDSAYGKNGFVRLNSFPANDEREKLKSDDIQRGRKLVAASRPHYQEVTTADSVAGASEKNIKENFSSDDGQRGRKLAAGSKFDGEVIKEDSVTGGSDKSTNLHANLSGLTGKTFKSSSQKIVNPRQSMSSMVSTLNSKTVSAERLITGKSIPESSLRNFRIIKANTDLLNSTLQKGPSKILDQKMEKTEQTVLRISHPVDNSRKYIPAMLSLKRKTSEESNADLESSKALKRLSESPKESRNFKETSPKIVEQEVRNHENLSNTKSALYEHQSSKLPITLEVHMPQVENLFPKSALYEHQSSKLSITREVHMPQVENPLVKENNGSVERAEAYTKELEDICNMLRKKHEEAKEIMVRAIVNNNKLLMLNHPVYEEKIRMVQHFAARLTSKELSA